MMKRILLFTTIFILFSLSAASAQETVKSSPKRIAFINQMKFEDEKHGIEKLVNAMNAADNYGFIPDPTPAKVKPILERRYKELVEPVRQEIAEFLKKVEAENNILIFDLIELDGKGKLLGVSDSLDITYLLIPLINKYFEMNQMPLLKLTIPESKLAAINSRAFLDEKTGINRIKARIKETEALIRRQTGKNPTFDEVKDFLTKDRSKENLFFEIGNSINFYAQSRNFGVVFDSSDKLPAELNIFQIQDITNDFISYYNQINP